MIAKRTADTVRLPMKTHLRLTITILQAMVLIKTMMAMPINKTVTSNNTEHKMLNELSNSKLIKNFYRMNKLKKVLKHILKKENNIKRMESGQGIFLKMRSKEFLLLLEGPTESTQETTNGEDTKPPMSKLNIHNMEMKWFNRIN